MDIKWTPVVVGFAMTVGLGIVTGLVYEGTGVSMAGAYGGVIGLLGGLTAGYLVGGNTSTGAIHGGLATVLGSVIVLALATATTLLFGGLVASIGLLAFGLLVLGIYAIPGAVGGAVGSWLKHRRVAPGEMGTRA